MAGINFIDKLISRGQTEGKVMALGELADKNKTKYMIVDFTNKSRAVLYDYGSDVIFCKSIKVKDKVFIDKVDDYRAEIRKQVDSENF